MRNAQKILTGCILIMVVWIVGIITYLAGSFITISIFGKMNIAKAYYYFFEELLNIDSLKNAANFSITLMIWMFVVSILVYSFVKYIVFSIPKLRLLKDYYYSNIKLLNHSLTLGVVFFGFFPLYLSLIKFDEDLIGSINVNILLFSAGFFVPYVALLIESIFSIIMKRNERTDEIEGEGTVLNKEIPNENTNNRQKEDKPYGKGYIKIYHLYYLLAIAGIIIILLTSFVFKSSEYAGAMLAFAATLSSILLAVIAIIITLIDVSGQKQNVFDMKKEIERLSEMIDKTSNISTEIEEGFEQMENRYRENTNLLSSMYALVEKSKKEDNPEEFFEKVMNLFNNNLDRDFSNYNKIMKSKEFKKAESDLRVFIYENQGMKKEEVLKYFFDKHPKRYTFFYTEALNHLIFNKEVEEDENGNLSIEFLF